MSGRLMPPKMPPRTLANGCSLSMMCRRIGTSSTCSVAMGFLPPAWGVPGGTTSDRHVRSLPNAADPARHGPLAYTPYGLHSITARCWGGVVLGRDPNGNKEGSGPAGEHRPSSRTTRQMGGTGEVPMSDDLPGLYHKAKANILRAHDGVHAARQAVSQSDRLGHRRKEPQQM